MRFKLEVVELTTRNALVRRKQTRVVTTKLGSMRLGRTRHSALS
jgi:hypothetical protein